MKKILGGCLIVALLALVVGGGATWWFVLRPVWNAGSQVVGAASQLAELAQIESKVHNRTAFSPPDDGRISDEALSRFLAVQQAIKDRLGPTLDELQAKYQQIETDAKANGGKPGIADVLGAYGDLFSLVRDAKQSQVDALNGQNLSLEEYRWIRGQAYAALAGGTLQAGTSAEPTAFGDNARRLAPHRELLAKTAVVAWLGM